jgi:hypothetical protein
LLLLKLGQVSELRALHDETVGLEDTTLTSNRLGSDLVVSSNHADDDSSLLAKLDSFGNAFTERILDTNDTDKGHVVKEILERNLGATLNLASILRGPCREVLVADSNGSKRPLGVALDEVVDGVDVILRHRGERVIGGRVAEDLATLGQDDFGGTLDVETGAAIGKLNDNTHALATRVERNQLKDLGILSLFADRAHAEVSSGKDEHGSFSLGTDKGLFAINVALKGSRVERDGLEEKFPDRSAEHRGKLGGGNIATEVDRSRSTA